MNVIEEAGKNSDPGQIKCHWVEKKFLHDLLNTTVLYKIIIKKFFCSVQQSPKFEDYRWFTLTEESSNDGPSYDCNNTFLQQQTIKITFFIKRVSKLIFQGNIFKRRTLKFVEKSNQFLNILIGQNVIKSTSHLTILIKIGLTYCNSINKK